MAMDKMSALAGPATRRIPFAIGSDGPFNPFLNIMLATIHPWFG